MTAICGIVSFGGSVVSRDDFDPMLRALGHHGLDDPQIHHVEFASLGRQGLPIAPTTSKTPPPHNPRKDLVIAASARIDNRSELLQTFGIPGPEQNFYADCDLILIAYEKWQERCPEFLLGDFAFGIWDTQERKLFCSRDHMGVCPLFYYVDENRFIFASEPKAILMVSGVTKKVNLNKLATLAFPAAVPLFWDQSWFENIRALPAGSSLTVDKKGIRKRKYWEPPRRSNKLPYKSEQETLDAFRDLMFDVVSARLRHSGKVTALLSGGLDSSAIVSVAARVLEHGNKELYALSAVLPEANDPTLTDEREFINEFRDWPNVTIDYVTAPSRGPFDDLAHLVWAFDSPLITSRHYLYSAFAEAARQRGANLILDGLGGELGPSFQGEGYYAELLLRLRWLALLREILWRTKINGDPLWRSLRSNVLHPLIPIRLLELLRPQTQEDLIFEQQQPLQIRFAQDQLAGFLPSLRTARSFRIPVSPNHRHVQQQIILRVQDKSTRVNGFVGYGQVEMSYPFMDKRLLEFCLAVPGNLKVRNGYKRYLIRAGLDKILPPGIQWRTTKQPFSPDYLRRYNVQRKQVQGLLAEIRPNDPVRNVVDVEKLKALANLPVAEHERGTFAESAARVAVPLGVYLIYFLRRFDEFRN